MRRLFATVHTDIRLQYRNGFYYAVIFVVAVIAVAISQLPKLELGWLMPGMVLGNLPINTFAFVAGLVLLEKAEETLDAQVVTPLRTGEYLASKVTTLSAISLLENSTIAVLIAGPRLDYLALSAGITLSSALYVWFGMVAVARYDSINQFLFPSMAYLTFLLLPLINFFGVWKSPLFYLHPLQPGLLLMAGALQPLDAWQWIYCAFSGVLWSVVAWRAASQAFERFIAGGRGGSKT